MKKIITYMITGLLSLTSCTKYDEIAMWNKSGERGDDKISDMSVPEEWCARMNTNAASLRIIVEALTGDDYVTGTVPVTKNGEKIGYTVTFIGGDPATIYHGADGLHATVPVIGIRKDSDGIYYWTLDGEWLTDGEKRITAQPIETKSEGKTTLQNSDDAVTPKLKIDDGYWHLSYDGKRTWNKLRPVAEDQEKEEKTAYCDIDDSDTERLVLTLTRDGERIELPYLDNSFDLLFLSGDDRVKEISVSCDAGTTTEIGYELVNPSGAKITVECVTGGGYKAAVDEEGRKIYVSAPEDPAAISGTESVILITATDDKRTVIRKISIGHEPSQEAFDLLLISGEERVKEMSFYCGAGTTTEIGYELVAPSEAEITVECVASGGYKATVDKAGKKIYVSAPEDPAAISDPENVILILASDEKRTIIRRLVVRQIKYIEYTATRGLDWNNIYGARFYGEECEYFDDLSSYDPATGKGKWAYAGTLTAVVQRAFLGETDIRSLSLPEGIETIGNNAFNRSAIETITLPESLVTIDDYAFTYTNIGEITIPANIERLGVSAFAGSGDGNSPLKKVTFTGNKLETIENNAFAECRSLREIVLPEGLKNIKYNAFIRCTALESITIPDAVTAIDRQVFSQCSALKNVVLGSRLETIGRNAFNQCLALETVLCPDDTPATLGSGAFPVTDGWGTYTANYKIYVPDAQLETYRQQWSDYWAAPSAIQVTKVIYGMSSMPAR